MAGMRIVALWAGIVSVSLLSGGCSCQKGGDEGSRAVARINNYKLTEADLKDEARLASAKKYRGINTPEGKRALLNDMITKQILLQEAQRANFDKDKAFMMEMQRYWEQALLKLLLSKRSAELDATISVDDSEVARALQEEGKGPGSSKALAPSMKAGLLMKKKEKAIGDWVAGLKSKAVIKIDDKALDEIEIK